MGSKLLYHLRLLTMPYPAAVQQPVYGRVRMTNAKRQDRKLLRRHEVSAYLKERHGITRSTESLAVEACKGSGPKYIRIGRLTFYDPAHIDAWVRAITTPGKPQNQAPKLRAGAAL
jgi:hypothetical protein